MWHGVEVIEGLPISFQMNILLQHGRRSKNICNALSYDFNTIEFAVENDIPYAIDYMNPAPDAEKGSVGDDNFEWVVETTATYLMECAEQGRAVPGEYAWSNFINGASPQAIKRPAAASRKAKK